MHDKDEDMRRERQDISKAKHWLLTYPRYEVLQLFELLDSNLSQQLKGIDLIGLTLNTIVTLEVKTRYRDYGDILIETYSKQETMTPGWITYSKADYLVYLIDACDEIVGSILNMPQLQKWWLGQDKESYPVRLAENRGYFTENRAVQYGDVPRDIYIYSDPLNIGRVF